ncbi:uncharacterized protein LOC126564878 [Anopheles maculipalpis]|uniref:uncharacterized protein LOC126564878 n=1 Tax=Anopheles maculipalpis TaxID=1496333 RepID=UPI002158E96D|nr:uncharacterized protein LOC126564878 [Anopheles maculipalpis]
MWKIRPTDPKAVMPTVKQLLRLSGFSQNAEHIGKIILPNLFVYVAGLLIPKVCFPYPNSSAMIQGLAELIFFTNIFVGVYCIILQHDRFRKLLNTIDIFVNLVHRSSDQEEFLQERALITLNRKVQKVSTIYWYYAIITASAYWSVPSLATYRSIYLASMSENRSSIQYYPNLEASFYWLDNRNTVLGYVIYGIVTFIAFAFACYNHTTKLLTILTSIKYCTTLLQIVSIKIENLDRTAADNIDRELKRVVQMHDLALRCVTLLNRTLSLVISLQLALCMVTWCLTLLYVLSIGLDLSAANGLIIMINITLEMFGYCFFCTELSTAGTHVARQTYALRWEQYPSSTQKLVQMIIARGQQPLRLTSFGFVTVNVELFAKVVKTSYSVLIVMKDFL